MAQLQIPIPDDLMAHLKSLAALRKLTLTQFVNNVLEKLTK